MKEELLVIKLLRDGNATLVMYAILHNLSPPRTTLRSSFEQDL